ncbi:MAG TPA: peptidoglycan editing factor PgeF [Herpetosiphonaceae bacterium]
MIATIPQLAEIETIPQFADFPWLLHGITTRRGGVSAPPHASLNIGFSRPDDREAVRENRRRVAEAIGFGMDDVVIAGQIHGTRVIPVGAAERGRGAYGIASPLPLADGQITDEPGVVLWSGFADCTPLLLVDPVRRAVGAIHAGWQGTVADIAGAAVAAMAEAYGSRPGDLLAAIGPAIGPCCYEVGEPVIGRVRERFGAEADALLPRRPGAERPHFDLWAANALLLAAAGVPQKSIIRLDTCTACNVDRFFSHRRERGATGRFAAIIGVRRQPAGA